MGIEEIKALLAETRAKLAVLLCHENADPDALGSAYALSQLLKKIQPSLEVELNPAQGASKISKEIVKALQMELTASPRIEAADIILLLDTSTIEQLGDWKTKLKYTNKPIVVIDHHTPHPETIRLARLSIINEEASSTCEIVYEMFKNEGVQPSERTAQALFLGIAFDTKHFMIASSSAFKAVADLIDFNVDARKCLSLLTTPMEYSERVSRLKAAKRMRNVRIGSWLVAISHVSSHQSSAARALLGLGAHVAVVCGDKGGKLVVSMRSSDEFYLRTGIHLGRDVAIPLGEYIDGAGGGHSTAAGVNGVGEFSEFSERCIALLREKVEERAPSQL